MPKQQIKSRYDDSVLYECEADSIREAVERAVIESADLRSADLRSADLQSANLQSANLRFANLRSANLQSANLRSADLRSANLQSADLRSADLRSADLRSADLTPIRDDLWSVLCAAPHEALSLRTALIEGRVNGSAYEGACACLVGTLANAKGCNFDAIPGLSPNAARPAERFFLAISLGDTPEKSQFAALAVQWIDEWHARLVGAFDGQEWPAALVAEVAAEAK